MVACWVFLPGAFIRINLNKNFIYYTSGCTMSDPRNSLKAQRNIAIVRSHGGFFKTVRVSYNCKRENEKKYNLYLHMWTRRVHNVQTLAVFTSCISDSKQTNTSFQFEIIYSVWIRLQKLDYAVMWSVVSKSFGSTAWGYFVGRKMS